jgi:hypothetical protein
MPKPRLKQLAQDGATDGQVAAWNNANGVWEPQSASSQKVIHAGLTAATQVAGGTYFTVGYLIWRGSTSMGTPTNIKALMQHNSTTADVRVFDLTNTLQIAEALTVPTALTINDMGTLSNISVGEAVWEVQVRETGPGKIDLYTVSVYF